MKVTKKETRRLDELAKTDPLRATAQAAGGELLILDFAPFRKAFERDARRYAPGCGTPMMHMFGQLVPCGTPITYLDGAVELHLCYYCEQNLKNKNNES